MAEFRKLPTQAELQQMLFMESMRVKTPQEIAQENLAKGTTIKPIPENVFQKIAGGARTAGEFVNRAGTAADVAKLFPGYTGQSTVNIPTSFNFAPKQAPTGEIIPGGLQTQPIQVNQLLKAIKPADVLGISGAERAYTDIGLGKAPQPLDVLDVAGLGALGYGAGKIALKATRGVPVGLSIQETKGLLQTAPKSDIGFYSAVEQAALATPRKSGTGQAFLNDISKGQDVRADEIKWMGLDEFLKGKQNVTRQEVQDYIANNRVDVQEVQYGTNPTRWEGNSLFVDNKPVGEIRDTSSGYAWRTPDGKYEFLGSNRMFDAVEKVQQKLGVQVPETISPKFGRYTLPGGENYRELLLTMPQRTEPFDPSKVQIYRNRVSQTQGTYTIKYGDNVAGPFVDEINVANNYAGMSDDAIRGVAKLLYNEGNELSGIKPMSGGYKSPHFSEPNILAHLRVNDRIDADGKKMLLIEEVQSDWHQAGRDKGYGSKYEDRLRAYYETPDGKQVDIGFGKTEEELNRMVEASGWKTMPVQIKTEKKSVKVGEGVPDAPFKDTWYQLALKRAIQHAAENGYDRIGLTTGSQQAARFDLSKQLSRVAYQDGVLHGYDKSGALVMNRSVAPNELPDYVGKELGKTMAENAAKDAEIRNKISVARYEGRPESEINALRSQLDGVKTDYSGLDLQVGGEGMKKYYDEIYPKFLDKYGKKWGAKVNEVSLGGESLSKADIENRLDFSGNGFKTSDGKFFDDYDDAMKHESNLVGSPTVRYLDITPEMKAGVSKGQPLFMAAPIGAGLLGSESMTPER